METKTDTPRTTVPRSAGTRRPAFRIQSGWWVYLERVENAPDGVEGEWAQVQWIADTFSGNRIFKFTQDATDGDGNSATAHKSSEVNSLTEREATKLGLISKWATS